MMILRKINRYLGYARCKYPANSEQCKFLEKYYNSAVPEIQEITDCKRGIIHICDGKVYHGGLTDRILGALSAYKFSLGFKLPFYICWTDPFDITKYLEPATFDWRISPSRVIRNSNISFPVLVDQSHNKSKRARFINRIPFHLFHLCHKRQFHYYTNLEPYQEDIPYLYNKLFKPSERLSAALKIHQRNLGSKYWSFSFRFSTLLGDLKDVINKPLNEEDAKALIKRNIEEFKVMISEMPHDYRILVASDSTTFLNAIKDVDPRIYIVPGGISHIDQNREGDKDNDDEIWMKTFIDQHLIMDAEKVHLMKTGKMYNSGFPRFAALIGNRPYIVHEF